MNDGIVDFLMSLETARTQGVKAWTYVWFSLDDDSVVFTVGPFPTEEAAMLSAEETLANWRRERGDDDDSDYRYVVTPLWPE